MLLSPGLLIKTEINGNLMIIQRSNDAIRNQMKIAQFITHVNI